MEKNIIKIRICTNFNVFVVMNVNITRGIVPKNAKNKKNNKRKDRNEALTIEDEEAPKNPKVEENKDLYY